MRLLIAWLFVALVAAVICAPGCGVFAAIGVFLALFGFIGVVASPFLWIFGFSGNAGAAMRNGFLLLIIGTAIFFLSSWLNNAS